MKVQADTDPVSFGAAAEAVEVVEKRTPEAKHFRNPDGSMTAVIGKKMHYKENGQFHDIDLLFRARGAEEHVSDRNDNIVTIYRKRGIPQIQLIDRETQKGIEYMLPNMPLPSQNRVPIQRDGLNWEYQSSPSGLKLNAEIAERRGQQTYSFEYALVNDPAPLSVDEAGNLISDVFSIPRAFVIGNNRREYFCDTWVVGDSTISFSFDDSALPDEAFPYNLDPTTAISVSASGEDSNAYAYNTDNRWPPTSAFYGTTTNTTLRVYHGSYGTNNAETELDTGLMRWNTSSINDLNTVTAARLHLYIAGVDSTTNVSPPSWRGEWHVPVFNNIATDYKQDLTDSAFPNRLVSDTTPSSSTGILVISLNNEAANINKGGNSGIRVGSIPTTTKPTDGFHVDIASWDSANQEPRLVVDYTYASISSNIQRHKTNTHSSTGTGDLTVTKPTRLSDEPVQEGDLLVISATGSGLGNVVSTGFTNTGVTGNLQAIYKIATASEPASYIVGCDTTNNGWTTSITVFTGHDPTNPINNGVVGPGSTTTSTICPSIDGEATNFELALMRIRGGATSSTTITPPSGWTEIVDRFDGVASQHGLSVKKMTVNGAQGEYTFTSNTAATTGSTIVAFQIVEAPKTFTKAVYVVNSSIFSYLRIYGWTKHLYATSLTLSDMNKIITRFLDSSSGSSVNSSFVRTIIQMIEASNTSAIPFIRQISLRIPTLNTSASSIGTTHIRYLLLGIDAVSSSVFDFSRHITRPIPLTSTSKASLIRKINKLVELNSVSAVIVYLYDNVGGSYLIKIYVNSANNTRVQEFTNRLKNIYITSSSVVRHPIAHKLRDTMKRLVNKIGV